MNTMTTYSGRKFDPMQMTPGDVYIEDIAHALSLLCRGGGQLTYFYSVGQHSLNCATEAKARGWSERQQLACLLHDASEGYISDIIRPVKIYLTNYLEIEDAASRRREPRGTEVIVGTGSGGAYTGRDRDPVLAGGRTAGGVRK